MSRTEQTYQIAVRLTQSKYERIEEMIDETRKTIVLYDIDVRKRI
jgi:hypothetical protein